MHCIELRLLLVEGEHPIECAENEEKGAADEDCCGHFFSERDFEVSVAPTAHAG
jgi:hypothetical protein